MLLCLYFGYDCKLLFPSFCILNSSLLRVLSERLAYMRLSFCQGFLLLCWTKILMKSYPWLLDFIGTSFRNKFTLWARSSHTGWMAAIFCYYYWSYTYIEVYLVLCIWEGEEVQKMGKHMKISHSNTQILEANLKFSVLLDQLFELIFRNSDSRKLIIVLIANLPGGSFCFGGCTSPRCRWCSAKCLSWRRPAFHILSYHYVKFLHYCVISWLLKCFCTWWSKHLAPLLWQ